MAYPFRFTGKNEKGHSPYIRAGVHITPFFYNGRWGDCWDQSTYDHVVLLDGPGDTGGHYAGCPFCRGEVIFLKHRYRCLDCERTLKKGEIEEKAGYKIAHGLEDDFLSYDPDYNIFMEYEFKKKNDRAGLTPRNI